MITHTVTAPGKIMIAGEYSVVHHGSAIIATIDRNACASVTNDTAINFSSRTVGNEVRDDHHPLFTAVRQSCRRAGINFLSGHYVVDTSAFFDKRSGNKLGLGSSAAATTALCKLIALQNNFFDHSAIFSVAMDAHRQFSGGVGSGGDVAAAFCEQSIIFKRQSENTFTTTPIDINWLWPNLCIIDTRVPQSTAPFINKFITFSQSHPDITNNFNQEMENLCVQLISGDKSQDSAATVFNQINNLLKTFGESAGIDIVSPVHQKINTIAKAHGGASKPSGAGGGDINIAIIDKNLRATFEKKITQLGLNILNLNQSKKHKS